MERRWPAESCVAGSVLLSAESKGSLVALVERLMSVAVEYVSRDTY